MKTTALITLTTVRDKNNRPMVEVSLPERIMKLIQSSRAENVKLNLGESESLTISAKAFRRVMEETHRRQK